jgi:hypothetical protein
MRVREWVVNQKELLAIGAVLGTLSVMAAVRGIQSTAATAPIAAQSVPVVVLDSSVTRQDVVRLRQEIGDVAGRVSVVRSTVDALLRVECITNRQKWEQFELAGIRCSDMVPSTVQAGRAQGR